MLENGKKILSIQKKGNHAWASNMYEKWTSEVNDSACDFKENKIKNVSRVIAGDRTFSNAYGNTCHTI